MFPQMAVSVLLRRKVCPINFNIIRLLSISCNPHRAAVAGHPLNFRFYEVALRAQFQIRKLQWGDFAVLCGVPLLIKW